MDKKQLHHIWTKLRRVRPWYFLILAIIFGIIGVVALRDNNQHMLRLRDAVYAADKKGGDTKTALQNLQVYVTSHMNTDLYTGNTAIYPPIQLKYTYDRLVKAESDKVAKENSRVYTEAQHYCESTNPGGHLQNRVQCTEQYVDSHSTAKIAPIPDALYKFAFVSPVWSPDLAGWSLVITALSLLAFIVSLAISIWLKRRLA